MICTRTPILKPCRPWSAGSSRRRGRRARLLPGLRLGPLPGGEAQIVAGRGVDWSGHAVTPEQCGNQAYACERLLCAGTEAGEEVMRACEELWALHRGRPEP